MRSSHDPCGNHASLRFPSGSTPSGSGPRGKRVPALAATACAALTLLLTLPAQEAAAQACLGSPAMTGQFTLGGSVSFPQDALGYGLESQSNLPGRVSMGARLGAIDLDDSDETLVSAGANLAVDLGRGGLSVCPLAGVGYDHWSGTIAGVDVDYSRTTFPLGVGVGSRLGSGGSAVLIPSARAGFLHSRHSGSAELGGGRFSRTDTSTDFFVDGSATVQFGRLYAQGGVLRVMEDDADTVFRIGFGVVF
jgi:hypothetical protein